MNEQPPSHDGQTGRMGGNWGNAPRNVHVKRSLRARVSHNSRIPETENEGMLTSFKPRARHVLRRVNVILADPHEEEPIRGSEIPCKEAKDSISRGLKLILCSPGEPEEDQKKGE